MCLKKGLKKEGMEGTGEGETGTGDMNVEPSRGGQASNVELAKGEQVRLRQIKF